jgi:hypothetical protein
MRSATFRIRIPDLCVCINCLPFLEENNIMVKILQCAPLGPNIGRSLLKFEGNPELLDGLLSDPYEMWGEGMKTEVARTATACTRRWSSTASAG